MPDRITEHSLPEDRQSIFWGGVHIKGVRHDEPDCIDGQPHDWSGPTSTGAEDWTLVHGTKCAREGCHAIYVELVQA